MFIACTRRVRFWPVVAAILVALFISVSSASFLPVQTHAAQTGVAPERIASLSADIRVTEAYVRMVARDAYFWGWPLANVYARRVAFSALKEPTLMHGVVPVAPLNHLTMLTDYIAPAQRLVACPNQDVVYGSANLALDVEPVVVQVPDFGDRFWVYQAVDLRTDSFVKLGTPYGTKPGVYLLVGPDWQGEVPHEIAGVFRSPTNTGVLIPRVFQNDTPEDKKAVQAIISGIDVYPLSKYTGIPTVRNWMELKEKAGKPSDSAETAGETRWVDPATFFDILPTLLDDAPALAGEEARYVQMRWLAALAATDPAMRAIMEDEATKAEAELVTPLLQFRNFGLPLLHHWATIHNGAAFGTDYFTRTAVAKANIFVNQSFETKYFYQDRDSGNLPLTGPVFYTITFPKGDVPVRGFWSLTLYNEHHFFVSNTLGRYSIGTKSQGLVRNNDGSLTLYIQPVSPGPKKEANWLPSPMKGNFSLYLRAYWPEASVLDCTWTPPPVLRVTGK